MHEFYKADGHRPVIRERTISSGKPGWIACLLVVSVCFSSAALFYLVQRNRLFWRNCPKGSMVLRSESRSIDQLLWDYATFWSNKARLDKSTPLFLETSDLSPALVLNELSETFQPLRLRPCPDECQLLRHRASKPRTKTLRLRDETLRGPFFDVGHDFGGMPLDPLFYSDIWGEFVFRDDVMNDADDFMMAMFGTMEREHYDLLIPIYLSTLTPEFEEKLSGRVSGNVRDVHAATLRSAMDSYRNSSKPLFFIMGNHTEAAGLEGKDVLLKEVPDNVALAVMSVSNASIFNHGLWPAFGAFLGRSHVDSFAMNKALYDAANNASFNWNATVVY